MNSSQLATVCAVCAVQYKQSNSYNESFGINGFGTAAAAAAGARPPVRLNHWHSLDVDVCVRVCVCVLWLKVGTHSADMRCSVESGTIATTSPRFRLCFGLFSHLMCVRCPTESLCIGVAVAVSSGSRTVMR